MQYDLRLNPKKFDPVYTGDQHALHVACGQAIAIGCHVLVHEHDRRGTTGRWVRLLVTNVDATFLSVRMLARSTDKCKRAA